MTLPLVGAIPVLVVHGALLALLGLGASFALATSRIRPRLATTVATGATVSACGLGAAVTVHSLLVPAAPLDVPLPISLPTGTARVGIDALSTFFLLCVYVVAGLAAAYGAGYLARREPPRRTARAAAWFAILVASMVGVVVARDGATFLVAWEGMTVSSFLLVTFHHREEESRRAGLVYLVASQASAALVAGLFVALSRSGGSLAFVDLRATGTLRGACFFLALVGFGIKAGFFPLHVWLPAAHPAAPSHVSALLSGAMIKMGIYGLARSLLLLGPGPDWWGTVLVGVGVASALLGVLHALAQQDLKRLLAYSSIENVGIVALGLGIGLLGRSEGLPAVAFAGFAGALLHVLHHGLFKGLLFQSAGSVLLATGTREMDRLGGLARRMPVTAAAFFVGAVAISGLPPLAGFVGEWLVVQGALGAGADSSPALSVVAIAVVAAIALVGGLAAACFVKAHGVVFLGTARSPSAGSAAEAPRSMQAAMVAGMGACVIFGVWPEAGLRIVEGAAGSLSGGAEAGRGLGIALGGITRAAAVLAAAGLGLVFLRARLLRRREVRLAETWACGWGAPTPRMQYTAESFSAPLLEPFARLVPIASIPVRLQGPFPAPASLERRAGDLASQRLVDPLVGRILAGLVRLRLVQYGRIQLYIAYIFLTLLAVFALEIVGRG